MLQLLSWVTHVLCPPTKSQTYQQAETCFSKEELAAIRKEHCVHVLSQYVQTIDNKHFLEWAGLQGAAPALQQGLCNAVQLHSEEGGVSISLDGVIVSKAMCEKMDRVSAEDFAFEILDVGNTGTVDRDHVQAVVAGCLQLAFDNCSSHGSSSDQLAGMSNAVAAIATGACMYDGGQAMTREGYSKWCKVSPALNAALTSLLSNIGKSTHHEEQPVLHSSSAGPTRNIALSPPRPAAAPHVESPAASSQHLAPASPSMPVVARLTGGSSSQASLNPSSSQGSLMRVGPGPGSEASTAAAAAAVPAGPGQLLLPGLVWGLSSPSTGLLQPGWVWLLAAGLPPGLRQEWRLLFSSIKDGMSFSTLLGRLNETCPTLLLVRDKGGGLFGGIAHAPWRKTGSFYGDYANVIFSLLPAARLYPASGINGNLQWCGVGFKELPCGLGFGGQVGHFAVWLDSTMDTGMSRPCATYASPCLASSQTFQVDAVEAWLLAPPEVEDNESRGKGVKGSSSGLSALKKATEDQKILEWAGVRKNYSDTIKDEPLDAED